jgi:hypothetical protein
VATTKDRQALIFATLDALGVLIPGQTPEAETVDRIDRRLNSVLASLSSQFIIDISNPGTADPPSGGEYPDDVFLHLASIVAQAVAGAFNSGGDPAIAATAEYAKEQIRIIARPERIRRYLRTDVQLRAGNNRARAFNFTTGR